MQFIDAIAYLSKVTNNVFDRLANRVHGRATARRLSLKPP